MAKPLDPRLQSPNDLPVVKVDNLYQLKREKLHRYQLHEFPFATAVSGTRFYCGSWEFMQILTDGGINENNAARLPPSINSACVIEFNDLERYVIKAETPTPIPLIKKQWFDFYNELGGEQSDSEGLETGYGNLKILLTNYPYQWRVTKRNPHFCNTDTLAASTHEYLWVGINKVNALYDTVIPYLPEKYGCIRVCWYAENVALQLTVTQYCCTTGSLSCTSSSHVSGSECFTLDCCSERILFDINNTHGSNSYDYCLDVKFLEGCGSCSIPS